MRLKGDNLARGAYEIYELSRIETDVRADIPDHIAACNCCANRRLERLLVVAALRRPRA